MVRLVSAAVIFASMTNYVECIPFGLGRLIGGGLVGALLDGGDNSKTTTNVVDETKNNIDLSVGGNGGPDSA